MDPSSATQPITRPTPIRRGRSYRKPAPIYVPSPTASPDVPAKRLSITSSREGPPVRISSSIRKQLLIVFGQVPPQWRDVIEAALADIGAGLTPTFEYHQNRSSNIMQEIRSLDSNEVIVSSQPSSCLRSNPFVFRWRYLSHIFPTCPPMSWKAQATLLLH